MMAVVLSRASLLTACAVRPVEAEGPARQHTGIADIDDVAGLEVLPLVELQRLHHAGEAVLVEPTGRGAGRLDVLDLALELVMVRRVGQGCEDLGRVLDGSAVVAKADQAEAHLD